MYINKHFINCHQFLHEKLQGACEHIGMQNKYCSFLFCHFSFIGWNYLAYIRGWSLRLKKDKTEATSCLECTC